MDTQKKLVTLREIPISKLRPFQDFPYEIRDDTALEELEKSLSQYGILSPILVLPESGGQYEIISGHRRQLAWENLGMETIPAIIKNVSREEAIIMMVDSNMHREILPSEKARSYKMKYEAIKIRNGIDYLRDSPVKPGRSIERLAEKNDDSITQIKRYIRLNNLNGNILNLVDEKKMGLTPAVELSYLTPEQQEMLYEAMVREQSTPTLSQSQRMRQLSKENALTADDIITIMTEHKHVPKEVVIPLEKVSQYFPNSRSPEEISEHILRICERIYQQKKLKLRREITR